MANITLNSGAGGASVATDTITAIEHQLVKLEFGTAGSATQVSAASPLPTDPQDRALRDNGKIDIAVLDQLPTADYDTGVGTQLVPMIGLGLPASGGTVPGGTATAPFQVSLANTAANATAVKVDGSAVTQPVSGTFWQATQPVSGTVSITANSSVNVAQLAGTATDTNSGVKSAGTLRVVIATDQPQLTNKLLVTPDADSSVVIHPTTAGGCSIYHVIAAATTNAANVKASAGQVYGWSIFNNAAYNVYVKLHNTAGTPTAGSGVVHTIGVPAGGGSNIHMASGLAFGTGIGITIVKDITDAGATAVAASDCSVDLHYK